MKNKIAKKYKFQIVIKHAAIITLLLLNILFSQITIASQLTDDLQYLLSSEPTIDYEDPRLKKILNKYEYRIFRTYKAFIEFDKSSKSREDVIKAKNELASLSVTKEYWDMHWNKHPLNAETMLIHFFTELVHFRTTNDLLYQLPEERKEWDDYDSEFTRNPNYEYKYFKIPLWLVMKHPNIVNYANSPYTFIVNAKKSVRDIPEFNKFISIVGDIHGGYLSPQFGKLRFDSYLMTKHLIDVISFNPGEYTRNFSDTNCEQKTVQERFARLVRVSHGDKTKMVKYKELLLYFDKASAALTNYYKNNYNLEQYADQTKDILSNYVCEHTRHLSLNNCYDDEGEYDD